LHLWTKTPIAAETQSFLPVKAVNRVPLALLKGIDAATLSRMESSGVNTVRGHASNIERAIQALAKHGVEMDDDSIRLVRKRRR
jgi:arabinogalactan endo-1,4-beta-galactosidase